MKPYRHNDLIKELVDTGELIINTETGEIRRAKRPDKLAYLQPDHSGYLAVKVQRNGKVIKVSASRLVAYAIFGDAIFQQNIEVDHKDRNRANIRGDNLQLITQLENTRRRSVRYGWYIVEAEGQPIAYCKYAEDAELIVAAHREQIHIA